MRRLLSPTNGSILALLTCVWALGLALSGHYEVLLYLAPALLIAAPLFAGRYVGEGLVVRARLRRPRRRRSAEAHLPRLAEAAGARSPRGAPPGRPLARRTRAAAGSPLAAI